MHVAGIVFHYVAVVEHKRFYKKVILRLLAPAEAPVDKPPFHPLVSDSAGIAGEIHPRREPRFHISGGAVAVGKRQKLELGEMRRLFHSDHLVSLPLILQNVAFAVAVAQLYPRPVFKPEFLFTGGIMRDPFQQFLHRQQMVFPQLRKRAP